MIKDKNLDSGNSEENENSYLLFFDDPTFTLRSNQSRFTTKIKTDELERLIENGRICIMP